MTSKITLIDKGDAFVFGFSKLDVMFGRTQPEAVRHLYSDIVKPGVQFVQATIESIDPAARSVKTDAGSFDGDIMVVALGADLDPAHTPGLLEGGHEFYTVEGAFAVADVIDNFAGGRVIVGVISTPFKCPPAPSETALLMNDHLIERGLREHSSVSLVMPFGRPIPPSPEASDALLHAFSERGIEWCPQQAVVSLDPVRSVAITSEGAELDYDLFLGVPHHVAPAVVLESGMCVDGWIPVNPMTLETSYENVYALGDCAAVGTPRAGVFAEGQAKVAAEQIAATIRGIVHRRLLRRQRHLLPRVRPQPDRTRRRDVLRRSEGRQAHRPVRRTSSPTRPSSARAASAAGSAASGHPFPRSSDRRSHRAGRRRAGQRRRSGAVWILRVAVERGTARADAPRLVAPRLSGRARRAAVAADELLRLRRPPPQGLMVVNADVVDDVHAAFERLFDARFPIRRMRLVDDYGASDYVSIANDNTSSFNCRAATGSTQFSQHAYGRAIDINPIENPYVYANGTTTHAPSRPYLDRSHHRPRHGVRGRRPRPRLRRRRLGLGRPLATADRLPALLRNGH